MNDWGLNDWRFGFDQAKQRFGVCRHSRKEISLSAPLVSLNDEAQVTDTILHEIAHALAGPAAKHGPVWKAFAVKVGANPSRCYDSAAVVTPAAPWLLVCDTCGHTIERHRRSKARGACPACCRRYAGGRYDARYVMRWTRNTTRKVV